MTPLTRRSRYASFIIVPPERKEPLSFNLPGWAYYLVVGAIPGLLVLVIGGVFLASWMAVELRDKRTLEARNFELEAEAAKVDHLERRLREFEEFRLRVLDLVGADVRDQIEARAAERLAAAQLPTTSITASGGGPTLTESSPVADRFGTLPSLWPVEGVISKDYLVEGDPGSVHHGIDIASSHRSPVRASGAGTVVFAGRDSVFGELIVLDHGRGVHSYYGHNSSLDVGNGDQVKRGEVIAHVGSTGESTAPHLHFEVRRKGTVINPRTYLVE